MFELNPRIEALMSNPQNWEEQFDNPLSMEEEIFLTRAYQDLESVISRTMNRAIETAPQMFLDRGSKNRVMELMKLQRNVRSLLDNRGGLFTGQISGN